MPWAPPIRLAKFFTASAVMTMPRATFKPSLIKEEIPLLSRCRAPALFQSSLLIGDDETALRVARDVAGSNNKFLSAEGWYTLARGYLAKGRLERADEAFKNTLTVNPVYGDLLKVDLLAGLLSFERGNYLDAVSHFQRHADDIPSLYYSIACFCQMKDIAKAVSSYQKLLSTAKKGIWVDRARILIGEAIYQTKDYDLAMTFFGPVSRRDAAPDCASWRSTVWPALIFKKRITAAANSRFRIYCANSPTTR